MFSNHAFFKLDISNRKRTKKAFTLSFCSPILEEIKYLILSYFSYSTSVTQIYACILTDFENTTRALLIVSLRKQDISVIKNQSA